MLNDFFVITPQVARAFNRAVTNPANYSEENRAIEWNYVAQQLGLALNDPILKALRSAYERPVSDRIQSEPRDQS